MPRKRNPQFFEKRRRELAKKQKRQEKIERRQGRKDADDKVDKTPGSEEPKPETLDSAESGLSGDVPPPATEPGLNHDEK